MKSQNIVENLFAPIKLHLIKQHWTRALSTRHIKHIDEKINSIPWQHVNGLSYFKF